MIHSRLSLVSELYVELYSYSPFVYAGEICVCQSPYVVHAQYLEDVLYSYCQFHVWCRIEVVVFVVLIRELEQCAGVERIWTVFVAQVSEHALERYYLTPVESAY